MEKELRKIWSDTHATYKFVLYKRIFKEHCQCHQLGYEKEECPTYKRVYFWKSQNEGNIQWAKRIAKHYGIKFPDKEYKI